jgi:hypothetical protein
MSFSTIGGVFGSARNKGKRKVCSALNLKFHRITIRLVYCFGTPTPLLRAQAFVLRQDVYRH